MFDWARASQIVECRVPRLFGHRPKLLVRVSPASWVRSLVTFVFYCLALPVFYRRAFSLSMQPCPFMSEGLGVWVILAGPLFEVARQQGSLLRFLVECGSTSRGGISFSSCFDAWSFYGSWLVSYWSIPSIPTSFVFSTKVVVGEFWRCSKLVPFFREGM